MTTERASRGPFADEEETSQQEDRKRQAWVGFCARFLTRKWLLVLLAVSVLGHGVGFAYSRLTARSPARDRSPEVSLGVFRFEPDPGEKGRIAGAEFSLHISLLSQVEKTARQQLPAKRRRVQQAVEELIRRAHSGDFEDPVLSDLKRRLQEQINAALGMRVIADVIITDLKLEHNADAVGLSAGTAVSFPWAEEPPG